MNRSMLRATTVTGLCAAAALLTAGPALAHVTVQPGQAVQGGYTVVSLRVPDESDTAGTVKLAVALPTDTPITSVRTTAIPGWTAAVTKTALNPPVQVEGTAVAEAVKTVTWTADPGTRIGPGEFLDFPLSLGPLPAADQLVLPATQTYDDGTVVTWNEPTPAGGAEPEHPVPTLDLAAAAPGTTGDDAVAAAPPAPPTADDTARWLGGAGLLVGALGVGVGVGAVLRTRRR